MQHLSNLSDSSPNHVNFIFKLTSAFVFGRCCVFSRCITRAQTGACFWRLCLLSTVFLHHRGKKPSHLKQTFWKWRKRESVIPLEKGKLIKAPCSLFSSTELLYFWWVVKRTFAFYKLGTITVCNLSNTGIHRLIKNILLRWTKYQISVWNRWHWTYVIPSPDTWFESMSI